MIIAKIDTFPLRIPFKPGIQAAASAWGDEGLPVADSLLVRVTTDQGLEGWGETFGFRAVPLAKLAIDELIAPLCIGRDATQIGPVMREVQKKLHIFGRSGPLFYGVSAIDIALWDIAVDGKILLTPVHSEWVNLTRVRAIEICSMNVGRGQIDCAEGVKSIWQSTSTHRHYHS